MGCATSREALSTEETYLVSHENELHFQNKTSVEIDMIFRKYQYSNSINAVQLKNAADKLAIRIANAEQAANIVAFYSSLKSENDGIPLQRLLLLGVLLGQGSAIEKAKLLFEVYDKFMADELDLNTIEGLLNDLYELAVVKLVILAGTSATSVEAGLAKQYLAKIHHVTKAGLEKLKKAIMKDAVKITKAKFVEAISAEALKRVVTSSGFRAFFFNEFTSSAPAVKTAFDEAWSQAQPNKTVKPKPGDTTDSSAQGSSSQAKQEPDQTDSKKVKKAT
jgi:hypothetical protein